MQRQSLRRWVTVIGTTAMFVVSAAACGPDLDHELNNPPTKAAKLERAADRKWNQNPVEYELYYMGREVNFKGRIQKISTKHVSIGANPIDPAHVRCQFNNKYEIAKLRNRQKVEITGNLNALGHWYVWVTNCRLK